MLTALATGACVGAILGLALSVVGFLLFLVLGGLYCLLARTDASEERVVIGEKGKDQLPELARQWW